VVCQGRWPSWVGFSLLASRCPRLAGIASFLAYFVRSVCSLLREFTLLVKRLDYSAPFVGFCHFPCIFLVGHVNLMRNGVLNSHHLQSPMWVEGVHMTRCCPVPQWIDCDTAIATSVPYTPWHDVSHLDLWWTRAIFTILGHFLPQFQGRTGLDFRELLPVGFILNHSNCYCYAGLNYLS
jgi:hypothetical protein